MNIQGGDLKTELNSEIFYSLATTWSKCGVNSILNRASHINTGMDRPTKIFDF